MGGGSSLIVAGSYFVVDRDASQLSAAPSAFFATRHSVPFCRACLSAPKRLPQEALLASSPYTFLFWSISVAHRRRGFALLHTTGCG